MHTFKPSVLKICLYSGRKEKWYFSVCPLCLLCPYWTTIIVVIGIVLFCLLNFMIIFDKKETSHICGLIQHFW